MASKRKQVQVPVAYRKGVWFRLFGYFYPVRVFTEKVVTVEVKRGRKVVESHDEVVECEPFGVICDPRIKDSNKSGISGITGRLLDDEGNHNPEAIGETMLVIDGEIIPFVMEPGMTRKEGARSKRTGKLIKRNPKFDTGADGVPVVWNGKQATFRLGVSQTTDTTLHIWGGLRTVSDRPQREIDPDTLVSLADLSALASE